ncbi:glutamate--tRNA ligase [Alphaproteobacteria bacterium]|nr:glutamate--tRNA ligase [Alphaproteobacteria bacterium]
MSKVNTRFAPSPTGYLHLGSARTALFNWLYARNQGGKFLLRIEDTDENRNSDEFLDSIIDGLKWLGLNWNDSIIKQSKNINRHLEVADELITKNLAYFCYASPEELSEMKEIALKNNSKKMYNGLWRNKDPKNVPGNIKPTIRFKSPQNGITKIYDLVQGEITIENQTLDDMVLVRADGKPTYTLASIVDDNDMGITHIIRGDDHLNNAIRQVNIINSLGWKSPKYTHIPLIYGSDGTKLSKRHGAKDINDYRQLGYLPQSVRNYLLRLGWSHGNDEIITDDQAKKWFSLKKIGKSPAKFDIKKLNNLNKIYINSIDEKELLSLLIFQLEIDLKVKINNDEIKRLNKFINLVKKRSETILDLAKNSFFMVDTYSLSFDNNFKQIFNNNVINSLQNINTEFINEDIWIAENIIKITEEFCEKKSIKLIEIAQPLRLAITGKPESPSIFKVMEILGKKETLDRITRVCEK